MEGNVGEGDEWHQCSNVGEGDEQPTRRSNVEAARPSSLEGDEWQAATMAAADSGGRMGKL
jgi:hypothetical protein